MMDTHRMRIYFCAVRLFPMKLPKCRYVSVSLCIYVCSYVLLGVCVCVVCTAGADVGKEWASGHTVNEH